MNLNGWMLGPSGFEWMLLASLWLMFIANLIGGFWIAWRVGSWYTQVLGVMLLMLCLLQLMVAIGLLMILPDWEYILW